MREWTTDKLIRVIIFAVFCLSAVTEACAPLPVLLYPAEETYAREGWEVPELPADAVAWIDGEFILRVDFEEWLYEKVGFDPKVRENFVINRALKRHFEAKGFDAALQKKIMAENIKWFDRSNTMKTCEEWQALVDEREFTISRREELNMKLRVDEAYLRTLYVMEHWDETYALGLERFDVSPDPLVVEGEDEDVKHIVRMNNAYNVLNPYSTVIRRHIRTTFLAGEDLNLPEGVEEYKTWLSELYGTVFLLETYVGMLVAADYAEEHQLDISEAVVQLEETLREDEYRGVLAKHAGSLPERCTPLRFSPVYAGFIMSEIRDDLSKSRAARIKIPFPPHKLMLRYHQEYGYNGQTCEVREIYRWTHRRGRKASEVTGYEEYAMAEEAKVKGRLEAIRTVVLEEGADAFYSYAITENRSVSRQQGAGLFDVKKEYGDELAKALESLSIGEMSPVMKATEYAMNLFMLSDIVWTNRVYHEISQAIPPPMTFDFETCQETCDSTRGLLEDLKLRVENGESFDELATEHSDNFDWTQGNITDTYQSQYGFSFARDVNAIPDGEMEVLRTENGFHLIRVLSREDTPLTDEIKAGVINQYLYELAPQIERYDFTKKLFEEEAPYFEDPMK